MVESDIAFVKTDNLAIYIRKGDENFRYAHAVMQVMVEQELPPTTCSNPLCEAEVPAKRLRCPSCGRFQKGAF